jgi:hypothetical protein
MFHYSLDGETLSKAYENEVEAINEAVIGDAKWIGGIYRVFSIVEKRGVKIDMDSFQLGKHIVKSTRKVLHNLPEVSNELCTKIGDEVKASCVNQDDVVTIYLAKKNGEEVASKEVDTESEIVKIILGIKS